MEATKIIKTIEDTDLQELTFYLGQKVEIIILPVTDGLAPGKEEDLDTRRK